jgi:hypothetical protein
VWEHWPCPKTDRIVNRLTAFLLRAAVVAFLLPGTANAQCCAMAASTPAQAPAPTIASAPPSSALEAGPSEPQGALGAAALRGRYDGLHEELQHNAFGRPLVLQATQNGDRLLGEVYAKLDTPFAQLAQALEGTDHWCAILILHLNVKRCHAEAHGLDMALGRKFDQAADDAFQLHFDYRLGSATPGYLEAGLSSADGPLGTHDYRISVEAEPLDATHSVLHMSYAYSVGLAARVATSAYLATSGASKVGFSQAGRDDGGQPRYVGGVRGLIERNTMRYYLAIEAYAASPGPGQLEQRLAGWFDATERYARQLHEVDKPQYLAMKREEVRQ